MKSVPLLIFALLAISALLRAEDTLESLTLQIEVELSGKGKQVAALNQKYEERLNQLKKNYQESGNLEGVLAVEDELENYAASGDQPVSTFKELRSLQKIYRDALSEAISKDRARSVHVLETLQKNLEQSITEMTKAGNLTKAEKALDVSKRLAVALKDLQAGPLRESPHLKAGKEKTNSMGMEFCWVSPGRFVMGSPEGETGRNGAWEKQVSVEITQGFWMGKYEVTQGQYTDLTGGASLGRKNLPIGDVSWEEAMRFCEKLTTKEREAGEIGEDWIYTLPTEAQWEYACRAGSGKAYGAPLDLVAWYGTNSGGVPHDVGGKKPNAWGLYDMHGNVWEWCRNYFSEELERGKDPDGPREGTHRPYRGGAWPAPASNCRAANRDRRMPYMRYPHIGFRVALVPVR